MHVSNSSTENTTPSVGSGEAEPKRLAYSVKDAVIVSGLSRSFLYQLIKDGTLASTKIGGRRLIRHADLAALLERGTE